MIDDKKNFRTRSNTKVCFIGGAGHSGSTLVGMVLGSHPLCFYAGEAGKTRYLHNPKKDPRKRMCKLCGPSCPIWSDFHIERGPEELYEQISQKTNKQIVIDSTKSLGWIQDHVKQLESTTSIPCFIFLQRDGRAVINSRVRKYPDRPPEKLITDWAAKIQKTWEFYHKFPHQKMILRYELFATNPGQYAQKMCDFLQIEYRPEMLDFYKFDHHPLGGNNGTQLLVARFQGSNPDRPYNKIGQRSRKYYENHVTGIRLDLRWKAELDPKIAHLFEQLAGEVNAPLRWEG